MRIFGFNVTRNKAVPDSALATYTPASSRGWFPIIRESFPGAWQRNIEVKTGHVLTHATVFRCVSLISSDLGKMRIKLMRRLPGEIWEETTNSAYTPVLTNPNRYQNTNQFIESWMHSKLIHGNTYVLKERDNRQVVNALYILEPTRTYPMVAPDGSVWYSLGSDDLSGLSEAIVVPASEIIHDRWNAFFHHLVGLSPITAAGLSAVQGLRILTNSALFFGNDSTPGGVLTAPGKVPPDYAERLQRDWEESHSGGNIGRVAVLVNGFEYKPIGMSARDSQLIDQLKWSSEIVAGVFGVPLHKAGIGEAPTYNNVEALNDQYYSQCLQPHIEHIERLLTEHLRLGPEYAAEFDLDALLRMDEKSKVEAMEKGVKGSIFAPNEARARFHLPPVEGGESPMAQIQNYSLAALARRDQQTAPMTPGLDQPPSSPPADDTDDQQRAVAALSPAVMRAQLVNAIEHAVKQYR